jgi:hypothetical protein
MTKIPVVSSKAFLGLFLINPAKRGMLNIELVFIFGDAILGWSIE